jgi:plasmid stabilization system protein ParE
MKFTVVWQPSAQDELADLWYSAADRAAVTRAADEIDRVLAISPSETGESRGEDLRIVIVPPLAANFRVYESDRQVRVGRVFPFSKR